MSANVETMFSVREKPWHGLGTVVSEAPSSEEALKLAGLDWKVLQYPIYASQKVIAGYKANVRDCDGKVLGVVSDRYKIIQNEEAFSFTDELLGEEVCYETAGSLQGGRRVWILAKLSKEYFVANEKVSPYLVFSNTHDGSGAVRIAITPIRVVCNNTLNLALESASRSFSIVHKGDVMSKVQQAKHTLFMADRYMKELNTEAEKLLYEEITDEQVNEYLDQLFPVRKDTSFIQRRNIAKIRSDLLRRYYDAPDLKQFGNNKYKFINAVSDFATHAEPLRKTVNYNENLFARTIDGNPLIDRAYGLLVA